MLTARRPTKKGITKSKCIIKRMLTKAWVRDTYGMTRKYMWSNIFSKQFVTLLPVTYSLLCVETFSPFGWVRYESFWRCCKGFESYDIFKANPAVNNNCLPSFVYLLMFMDNPLAWRVIKAVDRDCLLGLGIVTLLLGLTYCTIECISKEKKKLHSDSLNQLQNTSRAFKTTAQDELYDITL